MAQWIRSLSLLSWAGIDILTVLLAGMAGVGLSGVATQTFAWSKNRRAIRIVTQARQAAQAFNRTDVQPSVAGNMPAGQSAYFTGAPAASSVGVSGAPGSLAGAPYPPPAHATSATSGQHKAPAAPRRTLAPAPATPPTGISGTQRRPLPPSTHVDEDFPMPTGPARPAAYDPDETQTIQRTPSKARPAGKQLTDAMRDALATWASDNVEEEPPTERSGPQPSAYLNSSRPLPKRNRKKQNTRDWLC